MMAVRRSAVIAALSMALLVFALLSTYLAAQEMDHYAVLLAASALGYAMTRFEYNKATFILGFVLGGLAERNYELARAAFGPFFMFSSPIATGLVMMCVALLVYRPLLGLFGRARGAGAPEPPRP